MAPVTQVATTGAAISFALDCGKHAHTTSSGESDAATVPQQLPRDVSSSNDQFC